MKSGFAAFRNSVLLFFLLPFCSFAQTLYEVKFHADGIEYLGLLVYFNEQEAYMRIGYMHQNNYQVVNVKYKATTGNYGGTYYLHLLGTDPKFITESHGNTYAPDHFLWIWNNNLSAGLPYISMNPMVNTQTAPRVDAFSQLNNAIVTDTYLRRFFGTNEPEYAALRHMCGLDVPEIDFTAVSRLYTKLHLVIVANTLVSDIGNSCAVDQKNLLTEFESVAQALKINFQSYVVNDNRFTRSQVNAVLDNLKPNSNDIVIFIYRGHGYRWSNQTSDWPRIDLRYNGYANPAPDNSFNLEEIYQKIVGKGARLNIVMGDCCNSDVGIPQTTPSNFLSAQSNANPDLAKLKRLFMDAKGNLMASAAKPGEVSWANVANGGLFTLSFFQALHEEISYLRNDTADWQDLIVHTIGYARYKSSGCSSTQNGIYYSDIKY